MEYFELAPEDNIFSNLVVDLTHRCNMECANCYIPNRNIPDLDINKLYIVLDKLPFRTYIRLIGAEPTMRDDLPDIIYNVKKRGHQTTLTTNGLKLARMEYCQKLKDAGLNLVLTSMNGADDDEVYKVLDNGKWATAKTRALTNIFRHRFAVNTGTIIAKNVNEHTIARQIQTVVNCAKEAGVDFKTTKIYRRITPVLRMKSVGALGRNMGTGHAYSLNELAHVVANELNLNAEWILSHKAASGTVIAVQQGKEYKNKTVVKEDCSSLVFPYETELGKLYIRLIDWEVDDEGVIDPDNPNRGRLTQDFKIAPFFEHVKRNEFQY